MFDIVTRARGSMAALPTPYRFGKVDIEALEKLCERLIAHGTSALVPCGTTGEAPLLTPDEHRLVIARTVAAAAGRAPVIAGAGSNNTQTAIELAQAAEKAGASALLCVTPFYLKPSQSGLVGHFKAIHDAVGVPLILYDVPSRTGCALADVTVRRLADLPRVLGLKDATGNIPRVPRLRAGWAITSCSCPATTRPRRSFVWLVATAAFRSRRMSLLLCVPLSIAPVMRAIPTRLRVSSGSWHHCTPRSFSKPIRSRSNGRCTASA